MCCSLCSQCLISWVFCSCLVPVSSPTPGSRTDPLRNSLTYREPRPKQEQFSPGPWVLTLSLELEGMVAQTVQESSPLSTGCPRVTVTEVLLVEA